MKHSSLGWSTPFAFSFPHSFNIELFTFLKPCVSRLLEALCYSSSGAFPSSGDEMRGKWVKGSRRVEVGRRGGGSTEEGKILGQRRGLKNPWAGEENVFLAWTASSWTGALVAAGSLQSLNCTSLPDQRVPRWKRTVP
jgi:hypothetical protein